MLQRVEGLADDDVNDFGTHAPKPSVADHPFTFLDGFHKGAPPCATCGRSQREHRSFEQSSSPNVDLVTPDRHPEYVGRPLNVLYELLK